MVTVEGYASPGACRSIFPKGIAVMNVVYVLSPDKVPLMPCSCAIARLLLKQGKAKVARRTPFTIKLHTQPESTYTQPLTLGMDTGSAVMGSAVADEQGNILYLSEVEVRIDISHHAQRTGFLSPQSSSTENPLPPSPMAQSQEFHQDRALFPHDDEQNRRTPARNTLCAVIATSHLDGTGNRDL